MLQLMKPGFGTILHEDSRAHEQWVEALMDRDCLIESLAMRSATGIFTVGETARERHGLGDTICGLLDIIRSYHVDHRQTVLSILEQATAAASSFCFCTTLQEENGDGSPIFCVGTSTLDAAATAGRMRGIFAFAPMDG